MTNSTINFPRKEELSYPYFWLSHLKRKGVDKSVLYYFKWSYLFYPLLLLPIAIIMAIIMIPTMLIWWIILFIFKVK